MESLFEQFLGNPLVLAALLFLGPFVLEEVAIFTGAALAAAGELPPAVALAALGLGTVVSDWALYAAGAIAGRSGRIRSWIGEETILRGRKLLSRGVVAGALTARLVPWLLLPVFVASGFLGIGFRRFALVNAIIATVYIAALFFGVYGFNLVLFDILGGWGWFAVIACAVGIVLLSRKAARRYRERVDDGGED